MQGVFLVSLKNRRYHFFYIEESSLSRFLCIPIKSEVDLKLVYLSDSKYNSYSRYMIDGALVTFARA